MRWQTNEVALLDVIPSPIRGRYAKRFGGLARMTGVNWCNWYAAQSLVYRRAIFTLCTHKS